MGYTYDINMFKDTFEQEFTWLNGFMRNVRRFGFKPAMIDPQQDKVWTYEELNRDANRFANALKEKGVEKTTLFFIFCQIPLSLQSPTLPLKKSEQSTALPTLILQQEKQLF